LRKEQASGRKKMLLYFELRRELGNNLFKENKIAK